MSNGSPVITFLDDAIASGAGGEFVDTALVPNVEGFGSFFGTV
jgi:hypothetical protein